MGTASGTFVSPTYKNSDIPENEVLQQSMCFEHPSALTLEEEPFKLMNPSRVSPSDRMLSSSTLWSLVGCVFGPKQISHVPQPWPFHVKPEMHPKMNWSVAKVS